ncbi:hypothetical protein D1872_231430 [compost metagenome]
MCIHVEWYSVIFFSAFVIRLQSAYVFNIFFIILLVQNRICILVFICEHHIHGCFIQMIGESVFFRKIHSYSLLFSHVAIYAYAQRKGRGEFIHFLSFPFRSFLKKGLLTIHYCGFPCFSSCLFSDISFIYTQDSCI